MCARGGICVGIVGLLVVGIELFEYFSFYGSHCGLRARLGALARCLCCLASRPRYVATRLFPIPIQSNVWVLVSPAGLCGPG